LRELKVWGVGKLQGIRNVAKIYFSVANNPTNVEQTHSLGDDIRWAIQEIWTSFMEPEVLLQSSQELSTDYSSGPDESDPHPPPSFP
jgi:hypothetical protein